MVAMLKWVWNLIGEKAKADADYAMWLAQQGGVMA